MHATKPARNGETKRRLIAAASYLFAERGYHGTKVRDITARARVNLAAGNYHYGSKKALYLEVLRQQFAETRDRITRGGGRRDPSELRRLSRGALAELLRARVQVMLDVLIGPPPGLHGTLMQREMCDPSEALPVIVDEFVLPMKAEMEQIVEHLEPTLPRADVVRSGMSIVGQVLFYRFAMPAVLRIMGVERYPKRFSADVADYITTFSLAGMERMAAERRRGGGAR